MRGLRPRLPLPSSVADGAFASVESAAILRFSGREDRDAGGAGSGEQERDRSPSPIPGSKSGFLRVTDRDGLSSSATGTSALDLIESVFIFDVLRAGLTCSTFEGSATLCLAEVVALAGSTFVFLEIEVREDPVVAWKEGKPPLWTPAVETLVNVGRRTSLIGRGGPVERVVVEAFSSLRVALARGAMVDGRALEAVDIREGACRDGAL